MAWTLYTQEQVVVGSNSHDMVPVAGSIRLRMVRTETPSSTATDDSDEYEDSSDSEDADDGDTSDEDENDESDDDLPPLGPLQRLSKALRDEQQRQFDARRHPTLTWKAEQLRQAEQDALTAAEELELQRQAGVLAEKRGKRERKEKRRAQRQLTRQKERELRELLQGYEVQLAKSDTRSRLLAKFATENRSREKAAVAKQQAARLAADQAAAAQQVQDAIRRDAVALDREVAELKESTDVADRIGRRLGTLPAITSPAPLPLEEQDETSSLVVLRVNKSSLSPLVSSASTGSISQVSMASNVFDAAQSTAKRQFFTVNMKRFKHADTIQGESIGDSGAKELARSLLTGACPRVKTLQLGWNGIKFPGTAALADCFSRGACGQLQTLDLRFNLLDAQAFRSLVEVIEKGALPELLDLLLQGNVISDEGARLLSHAVLRGAVRGLRTIDIRQNCIRSDGVRALWNVFTSQSLRRFSPKLQMLDMRRNEAHSSLLRSFCPCPAYLQF